MSIKPTTIGQSSGQPPTSVGCLHHFPVQIYKKSSNSPLMSPIFCDVLNFCAFGSQPQQYYSHYLCIETLNSCFVYCIPHATQWQPWKSQCANLCQYVTARSLPYSDRPPVTLDMCMVIEAACGTGTIRGTQSIQGLWQINPGQRDIRNKLLVQGMSMKVHVEPIDKNPFILSDQTETSYQVQITNTPLSRASNETEEALRKIGCKMRLMLRSKLARDRDGKLADWETFITSLRKQSERLKQTNLTNGK